ncbi:hypothetical protein EDB92DRAFT_1891339, partial [Lactarius akahatsu]
GLMSQPFQSLRLSAASGLLLNLTTALTVLYCRQHLSDFLPLIIHFHRTFCALRPSAVSLGNLRSPSHQLTRPRADYP